MPNRWVGSGRIVIRRQGGGGFDPLSISGLKLWLDANDPATLFQDSGLTTPATADADPVGGWKDKSGNNNHATQAVAGDRGTLKLAIQNGLPIVRFDGTSDSLELSGAGLDILKNVAGATLFAAFKGTAADARFVLSFETNASGTLRAGLAIKTAGLDYRAAGRTLDADTAGAAGGGTLANVWHTLVGWFDYTNGDIYAFLDGAQLATSSTTVISNGNTSNTSSALAQVGALAAVQFFPGDVAEVLVYTSALSVANRQAVESYLNSKWVMY